MTRIPRKTPAYGCKYTKIDPAAECNGLEIGEHELETTLFEIISKQASVIMNLDRASAVNHLSLCMEQRSEYEKMIQRVQTEKRKLYERLILGEITADEYKDEKTTLGTELTRLNGAYTLISADAARLSEEKKTNDALASTAEDVFREDRLTRPLVDVLIEKVYVYPGDHIEVVWKVADFANTERTEGKLYAG